VFFLFFFFFFFFFCLEEEGARELMKADGLRTSEARAKPLLYHFSRTCSLWHSRPGARTAAADHRILAPSRPMSSALKEAAPVALGAQEPPEAIDGVPNDAPAEAIHGGVSDADAAAGQQQEEKEEEDDVLMLPAFQTGDMVVCPNPRRTGLLWPVSGGALAP